ncbi:MAG: hypothetical protein FWH55_10100 [Oscillospiraceae bacterium]|nr:hypothetical protein [Oscillospiraceae bacterium]
MADITEGGWTPGFFGKTSWEEAVLEIVLNRRCDEVAHANSLGYMIAENHKKGRSQEEKKKQSN